MECQSGLVLFGERGIKYIHHKIHKLSDNHQLQNWNSPLKNTICMPLKNTICMPFHQLSVIHLLWKSGRSDKCTRKHIFHIHDIVYIISIYHNQHIVLTGRLVWWFCLLTFDVHFHIIHPYLIIWNVNIMHIPLDINRCIHVWYPYNTSQWICIWWYQCWDKYRIHKVWDILNWTNFSCFK